MKPGRKDMPKMIALGVIVAVALGYVAYTVTSGGPSHKSSKTAKKAVAQETKVSEDLSMPGEYVGKYVGRYVVNDSQSREWAGRAEIAVDDAGAIVGHVWLPSSDGGPGLVSIVTGQVEPGGALKLRSDRVAAGAPDGKLHGTPIEKFQFRHIGQMEKTDGKVALVTEGKGNQGLPERLVANKTDAKPQVAAQASVQPAVHAAVAIVTPSGRDPFAPYLVPDQFCDQIRPVARPAVPPATQLAKLPTFSGPSNVALGIKPLPPVPGMDEGIAPVERDPDFVVTGVIIGPTNVAIIRAGTERHIVREGQTINGKYLVRTITRDQVVLKNKHNQIYLKLGGSANAS